MQYHCENILNIFWPGRKIKSYRVFLKQILNQTKDIKVKKWKVSYIVILILVDLLMSTQILIDISYDPMPIFCQQCCQVDWDCDSLIELNIKQNIEPNIEPNIVPINELNIEPNIEPNIELNIELNIEMNILQKSLTPAPLKKIYIQPPYVLLCAIFFNWNKINTSLAAPGALANRLQRRTACNT